MKEINEIVLEMPLFYARKYDLVRGRKVGVEACE
jgi:hypothetical protein